MAEGTRIGWLSPSDGIQSLRASAVAPEPPGERDTLSGCLYGSQCRTTLLFARIRPLPRCWQHLTMRFDTDRLHCHFLKDDRIHPLKWPGESMVALSNGGPLVKVTALWIDLGLH